MNRLLNDLSAALRRLPGGGQLPSASPHHIPGYDQLARPIETLASGYDAPPEARRTENAPSSASTVALDTGAASIGHVDHGRSPPQAITRPGRSEASWSNPMIDTAMPVLLRVTQILAQGQDVGTALRGQLALEVRLFRDRLAKLGTPQSDIQEASYLLCTHLDELVNDAAHRRAQPPYGGERSLLVEFHGDAWGGEDAFTNLESRMRANPVPLVLLEFYELILSMGWQGRYRILDRGDILLADLRARLHGLIWNERQLRALAAPHTVEAPRTRPPWLTWQKVAGATLGLLLLLYGLAILDLALRSGPLKRALAAWEPPMRTIVLTESLPPPLPRLLTEGWLNARKHPEGWVLALRSDGAFDVGKAEFRDGFRKELDRLGAAFAPWPGDMEIIGHSDVQPIRSATGPYRDNMALSLARAEAVATELQQTATAGGARAPANAMPREILWRGKGDTELLDTARTPEAHERNRRVDIIWKVAKLGPQATRAVER